MRAGRVTHFVGSDQAIEDRALMSLFVVNHTKLSLPGEYISHEI
jgi:hypothetical protein